MITEQHTGVRRYRVLHSVRSLRVDGIVVNLLRMVKALDETRFESRVCFVLPDVQLEPAYRRAGVEPVLLEHRGHASTLATLRRIARYIRENEIDIVHTNHSLDSTLVGLAARACNVPVVSSLHWLAEREADRPGVIRAPLRNITPVVRSAMDRWVVSRVIAVSQAVRETHVRIHGLPAWKTDVVYPGLAMSDTTPPSCDALERLRAELALGDAQPLLLGVGRLVPGKGQEHLLRMLPRVLDRWPDALLLLVGDGPRRAELEGWIAGDDRLARHVRLLGWRSDVDALLALSDLLLLPSDSEAAPLPLMEAMRAGKPVVATAVGGIPEIVADGVSGRVVPRADAEAMAAAVLETLGESGRAERMGAEGRRIACERFDIRETARATERIYLALLEGEEGGAV